MNNNRNMFLVVLLMCLATTIAISGCVDKDQENEDDDVIVMTFGQYLADSSMYADNETKQVIEWLRSLDPGDILLVRDTINNITFLEISGVTMIDFASSYLDDDISIEGDITDEYAPGDNIILQLTIIRDTFTWTDTTTGELWTYNLECVQEMWDAEQNTYVPIPSYYIRHG